MSGPVLRGHSGLNEVFDAGTFDGIDVTVRVDLAGWPLIAPPLTSCGSGTIYDYMREGCHLIGDFQFGSYNQSGGVTFTPPVLPVFLCAVIGFSKPIHRVRMTSHYATATGLRMIAVKDAADINPDGTCTALTEVTWEPGDQAQRTLTSDEPFSFLVLRSNGAEPHGYLQYGPTFKDFYFYENLPLPAIVEVPPPDLALPPGAGRSLSYWWPPFTSNLGSPGLGITYRQWPGVAHDTFPMIESAGGVGSTSGLQTYHGREAIRVTCPAGSLRLFQPPASDSLPFSIYAPLLRPLKADIQNLDDYRCWRVSLLAGFDAPQACPSGMGLTLGAGGNTQIVAAAQAGIFYGLTAGNAVAVKIRQVDGGPLTYDAVLDVGEFTAAEFHRLEVRLIGATIGGDAYLGFWFDNDLFLVLPWGAGSVLPDPVNSVNALGYRWNVGNYNGGAGQTQMWIAEGGVEVHAAATEDALL